VKPPTDRLWTYFFHAAVFFALFPGFATGGALFATVALGFPIGAWWQIHAQGHGHAEVFGWAGMMVLGVGYHFLPRLRGSALALPGLAAASFWVLVAGLGARVVLQSSLALRVSPALLPAAGAIELGGVTLALIVLRRTFADGPSQSSRPGFAVVRPFVLVAFASLWLSLGLDLIGLVAAAADPTSASLASWGHLSSLDVAFTGFLVPIGVAMSARTFPLYFRTRLPDQRVLRLGLGLSIGGLVVRLIAQPLGATIALSLGEVAGGLALAAFPLGLGIFAERRPAARADIPRKRVGATELLAIAAYAWMGVAAVVFVANGLGDLGILPGWTSVDAVRHALGAGYVTLLIFGVGARLLAGFANRPLRAERLVWATLAFGVLAALLRVGPRLVAVGHAEALLASAGLLGVLAVGAFWWNVPATARGR
jgi:uncharacterized protein involved in response to NO